MTPSPTVSHNRVRDRIFLDLKRFVEGRQMGEIMLEMDFQLAADTGAETRCGFRYKQSLAKD